MQAYIHFRSVFDVSPVGAVDNALAALIGEIRAWIARKEKNPLKGFFFVGGTWTASAPTWARIETRAISQDGAAPEMWAMRYEHADGEVKPRRWTTDVGVAQVGPQAWRVSMALTHRLRPGYVGREPPTPQPSSPRLISGLLDSRNWVARVGSMRLSAHPQPVTVGKAPAFANVLTDVHRLVPVVLVSCDRKTGVPKLDSANLSRALAGTASVYLCESPECDYELEHFVPMPFRSPNGTVRIYAPGVDFTQEWSSARHRFFTAKQIDEQGDDEIISQIVRALTRSDSWRGLQSSVASIDDIEARVRERRLGELRNTGAASLKEKDEMLALYESENVALTAEAKRLSEELEAEKEKRSEAEDIVARREYELEQARASADEARAEVRAGKHALQAVADLVTWPDGASDVAALAVSVSEGRLVFSKEAARSLERSKFATCNDATDVVWRCLRAMATELYDLLMADLPAQQVAEVFKSRTKFGLTWTESKETKRDNRLMAQRRMMYDGREIDITAHVKWGDSEPRLLRVHFWVDRNRKQLVIGHCGDHLDTYGTRRRR